MRNQADELGSDLVEVTAHAGARPSHAVWQGQIYSRSGKSRSYPDFVQATGYGTGAGLGGWNCRHSFYPYFEGTSRTYSKELLDSYQAQNYTYNGRKMTEYEASQMQRGIERQIRRWKRENAAMQAAGLDSTESAVKLRTWQEKQKDFLRQTGLKRQTAREQVNGWSRKNAAQASGQATASHKQWLKSIGAQDTSLSTLAKYYEAKYNNPQTTEYKLLRIYARDVENGWISPNASFENYLNLHKRIQTEIVGRKTDDGTEITGQRIHFMQRVLGTAVDPEKYRKDHRIISRSGVEIDDIKVALFTPERIDPPVVRKDGKRSVRYIGPNCVVTLNPDTGDLIQTNLRKKMKK